MARDYGKMQREGGNAQQPNGYRMSPSKMSEGLKYHNMREIQARS
jgi:hypothetical protein